MLISAAAAALTHFLQWRYQNKGGGWGGGIRVELVGHVFCFFVMLLFFTSQLS